MDAEQLVEQHQRGFLSLLDRFGFSDEYEMSWKWNQINRNIFGTVTVRHRNSGAWESYNAAHPPENPRYWLRLLERALVEKTFGSGCHQTKPE